MKKNGFRMKGVVRHWVVRHLAEGGRQKAEGRREKGEGVLCD
jgi:hypothetical protein